LKTFAASSASSVEMYPTPSVKVNPFLTMSATFKVTSSGFKTQTNFEVEKHWPLRAYFLSMFFSLLKFPIEASIWDSEIWDHSSLWHRNQQA